MRSSFPVYLVLTLLSLGCGSPDLDDGVARLQEFLVGEPELELDAASRMELNATFARSAVRGSGYARNSVTGDAPEFWSPVVTWDHGEWQAADVTPWLAAGDIDENGAFTPCRGGACAAEPAHALVLAVGRLVDASSVSWSESAQGIELRPQGVVAINPRLVELVDYEQEGLRSPAVTEQQPAPTSAWTSRPLAAAPAVRTHDPSPNQDSSDGIFDCDCGKTSIYPTCH